MDIDHPLLLQPVCRPTRRSDVSAIREITRHTWNGLDYVPRLLEKWLMDPFGWIFTAELSGKAVGIIKLSVIADNQWWIEGLRVDPSKKNGGIGKHLLDYSVDFWQHRLSGTLQMLTGEMNTTSQHLAGLSGFKLKQKLRLFSAPPASKGSPALTLESVNEIQPIIQQASEFKSSLPLLPYLDSGWVFNSFDAQTMVSAFQSRSIWKAAKPNSFVIMHENPEGEPNQGVIQAILCQPEDLEWFLLEARKVAYLLGWIQIHWMVPEMLWDVPALTKTGYQPNPADSIRIYERIIPHLG